MKKILITLLLASSLLLGGCTTPSTETPSKSTEESQTVLTDDPTEDDDYLELERRETSGFHKTFLSFHSVPWSVSITLPKEWELTAGEGMEQILLRDGEEIGRICAGETTDTDGWKTVATRTTDLSGFPVEEHIEKSGIGDTLAFRYRYYTLIEKDGQSSSVTMTVSYSEVDENCAFRLLNHTEMTMISGGDRLGDLAGLETAKIAILGNSFVNSSKIGSILQEMLNKHGKNAKVTPYSWGYAKVGTFASDTGVMNSIRNGTYDVIFLCGFYSSSEVSNLATIKKACEQSGTRLVIFPAHNESRSVITSASNQQPSLYLMDWKQEIDSLITEGIDKWDMCVNDQHLHSKPLAGYVGAHMIYRAIYGTLPQYNYESSYVSMSQVRNQLKEYLNTGITGDAPIYLD